MATGSLLPVFHSDVTEEGGEGGGGEMDLGLLLGGDQLHDDSFLTELLNSQGDDLLSSLLGPTPPELSPMTADPLCLSLTGDLELVNTSLPPFPLMSGSSPTASEGYLSECSSPPSNLHSSHSPTSTYHPSPLTSCTSPPQPSPSPTSCASPTSFLDATSLSPGGFPIVSSTFPDTQAPACDVFLGNHSPSYSSRVSPPTDTRIDVDLESRFSGSPSPAGRDSRKAATLVLTDEERSLLEEEGITLPMDMPLTKSEQKHLKRIRRKIKNKISAQESRKRKKEYVEGLEHRVEKCTEVNHRLQKKVHSLESDNQSLLSQLRKLQSLVANYNPSRLQAGTIMMVVVLSFSLFFVPWIRPRSIAHNYSSSVHLRTLLFAETDEFGNVIDPETGHIISAAGGQTPAPYPPPPWVHQTPATNLITRPSERNPSDSGYHESTEELLRDL